MTVTIVPAIGAGVLYTQQGVGTTPGYGAIDDRRQASGPLQEGVLGTSTLVTAGGVSNVVAADFMVTQRQAGANLSVDINMPAGGFAYVNGDTVNGQGLYCVPVHAATINEAVAAADLTNPRVDQVILEVQDNILDGSGGNQARTRVLTGTPTSGATLTNRSGATALPGSALLLADVLVPANATTVPNTNIRDRRKWARGALVRQVLTSGNVSTTSTSLTAISASLLARLECSGAPVRLTLNGVGWNQTSGQEVGTGCFIDGAAVDSTLVLGFTTSSAVSTPGPLGYSYMTTPSAGSHTFQPAFNVASSGTAVAAAVSAEPLVFTVEEVLKTNAANSNGVTTG
jgi:hypothetical protein